MRFLRVFSLFFACLAACGGKSHETREGFRDSAPERPTPSHVGIVGPGGAPSSGQTPAESGAAGMPGPAGAGAGAGAAGAAAAGCEVDADCTPPGECLAIGCIEGRCVEVDEPYGTPTLVQTAGDCSKSICNGAGQSLVAFDPADLPQPQTPCLTPLCTAAGPSFAPSTPRTLCARLAGSGLCDGAGECVECLEDSDCAVGSVCGRHGCVLAGACKDSQKNGRETAIDCGGLDCDPCRDGEACVVDQDCASDLCDPLFLRCLPESCRDGVRDGDETDVDCGGATCAGCYYLQKCAIDADCATQHCDSNKGTCVGNACSDQRQDGSETDVDCGAFDCAPCIEGKKCHYHFDCSSGFCNSGESPRRCR